MVGALFGIIIANKMEFVKRAYGITESEDRGGKVDSKSYASVKSSIQIADDEDGSMAKLTRKVKEVQGKDEPEVQISAAPVSEEAKKANGGTVIRILMWWAATLPVALVAAVVLTYLCLINAPEEKIVE